MHDNFPPFLTTWIILILSTFHKTKRVKPYGTCQAQYYQENDKLLHSLTN